MQTFTFLFPFAHFWRKKCPDRGPGIDFYIWRAMLVWVV